MFTFFAKANNDNNVNNDFFINNSTAYIKKNKLPYEKDSSGRKKYSEGDIAWIEFLKRLKTTRMSLKDIGRYAELRYAGDQTSGERKKLLAKQLEKIIEEMERLTETKEILVEKIKVYNETEKKQQKLTQ